MASLFKTIGGAVKLAAKFTLAIAVAGTAVGLVAGSSVVLPAVALGVVSAWAAFGSSLNSELQREEKAEAAKAPRAVGGVDEDGHYYKPSPSPGMTPNHGRAR